MKKEITYIDQSLVINTNTTELENAKLFIGEDLNKS